MLRAKNPTPSRKRRTAEQFNQDHGMVNEAPAVDDNDKVKRTLYLPKDIHNTVTNLAKARRTTINPVLVTLIEHGLACPDDDPLASLRSELLDIKKTLLASFHDRSSTHLAELSELQSATDDLLWATVTILTGRLQAGDFGSTIEDRRSRKPELDCLVEEYLQHHAPTCLSRIMRKRSRH